MSLNMKKDAGLPFAFSEERLKLNFTVENDYGDYY